MEERKERKQSPKLDMNPMVDLAFLLVTFFMLTTTFRADEPVLVDSPASQSEVKLPEKDVLVITVDETGRVFFNLDNQLIRGNLLSRIGELYGIPFTEEEAKRFTLTSTFGMPVAQLKNWLSLSVSERKEFEQPGIPCDSTANELRDWIVYARISNPKLRVALKGDANARYPEIQKVIKTLVENKVTRFNLITELEKEIN